MTTPGYLLNNVTISSSNGPAVLQAGYLATDPTVQAGIAAMGGQLGNSVDAIIAAAATTVTKLRRRGDNEAACTAVMVAAQAASAAALKFANTNTSATANADVGMEPAPIPKPGSIVAAVAMLEVQPASGESVVLQVRKNGTNISGATVTLSSSTTAKTPVTIPSMVGVTYAQNDEFDVVETYTAGGSPALAGTQLFIQFAGTP